MAENDIDFGILAGSGAPVREFKAGATIFKEGDPAGELFVIQSGKVEIRLGNRLLSTLSGNAIFGEMALIDHRRQAGAGDREAVPVHGEPHPAFRAQRHARFGAAAADPEHRGLTATLFSVDR